MRKIFSILTVAIYMICLVTGAFAATSATQSVSIGVKETLALELASDAALGTGAISWSNVEPTSTLIYPDGGHVSGKSDVGVRCKSNRAGGWQLKLEFNAGQPEVANKIKYYMALPTFGGTATVPGTPGNGTLANTPPAAGFDWPVIPNGVVYTSGGNDSINTPNGSYAGISYALDPTGLQTGTPYSGAIVYTITAKP